MLVGSLEATLIIKAKIARTIKLHTIVLWRGFAARFAILINPRKEPNWTRK